MIDRKKLAYKTVAYSTVGLALFGSSVLTAVSVNQQGIKSSVQQNAAASNAAAGGDAVVSGGIDASAPARYGFIIRSNPTNGFNGLTTADGKYTYVLITRANQNDGSGRFTPDKRGGNNSGIACINNATGSPIGTWYLPTGTDYDLNYTTNIVFGQKTQTTDNADGTATTKTVFDESKLFVLCGISNLAAALNNVYGYDETNKVFTADASKGPTIKIFSVGTNVSAGNNVLDSSTQFYNFAYPSDGTNGYAGFNASGYIYDMQTVTDKNDKADGSMYFAKGVTFDGIKRDGYAWGDGESWNQAGSFTKVENTTIGAFASYMTYLTYGQNFAYHLGEAYKTGTATDPVNVDAWENHQEFIMTTSFVNVDQKIGGLYSASVHNNGATDSTLDGMYGHPTTQENWAVPFGYQWLLADIANSNKDEANKSTHEASLAQYNYVDEGGASVDVKWDSPLALSSAVINFLNQDIFPTQDTNKPASLYESLQVGDHFGANWGAATGYIIYSPGNLVTAPKAFDASDINDYRYYYIAETVKRAYDDYYSYVMSNGNYSSTVFTNVLATDRLTPDGSLSYIIGDAVAYSSGSISSFNSLATVAFPTMFNYDWASLSNDDAQNSLIMPLDTSKLTVDNVGGYYDYLHPAQAQPASVTANADPAGGTPGDPGTQPTDPGAGEPGGGTPGGEQPVPEPTASLVDSFKNWNLIFLGGPTAEGIKEMDAAFTIDSSWGGANNSFVYKISNDATDQNPTNLGRKLTFVRRKISFLVHPYNGFVYFTSGASFTWNNGLSLWDVRNFGTSALYHSVDNVRSHWEAFIGQSSRFVGNIFLSADNSSTPRWSDSDEAIWDVKEIMQPYSNSNALSMVFTTSKGIYTATGYNRPEGNGYEGTVNNFFAASGTSWDTVIAGTSGNPGLLSAIDYTQWQVPAGGTGYGAVTPNVLVLNDNSLGVIDQNNSAYELYSVQANTDWTITDALTDSSAIPDRFPLLKTTPATKPLLPFNKGNVIHAATDITVAKDIGTLKYEQVAATAKSDLKQFLGTVLGLSESTANSWVLNTEFDQSKYGSVISSISGAADAKVSSANIYIPVKYHAINDRITYFAPVETNSNYSRSYVLGGLQPSSYAPVVVIIKTNSQIMAAMEQEKLSNADLIKNYAGKDFNQADNDKLISLFVDTTDTDLYKGLHQDYLGKMSYWLKLNESQTGTISLSVQYDLEGGTNWGENYGQLCSSDYYYNGEFTPGSVMDNLSVPGFTPLVIPYNPTPLIIGVVVAVIVAVTLALGLGIGLPMRKQHKINVLNSKITNKRIDKLSTAVSASFKKVIEATSSIGKEVSQLKSTVNRSLTAGNAPRGTTPPGAPARPTGAAGQPPHAPGAPARPGAPRPTGK